MTNYFKKLISDVHMSLEMTITDWIGQMVVKSRTIWKLMKGLLKNLCF